MMINVNLSLALLTIIFRKFCDKLKSSNTRVISKRPFWQKHLLYVTPCMYLSIFCAGLYYTYKQVDQRRNILFNKKPSRMIQIKEHVKRRRFIERNKIWFLKNLASGNKGREEVLKVLSKIAIENKQKAKQKSVTDETNHNDVNQLIIDQGIPMQGSYSDSNLSLDSRIPLHRSSFSSINLQHNANLSLLNNNQEMFYDNLSVYENFDNNFIQDNVPNAHGDSTGNLVDGKEKVVQSNSSAITSKKCKEKCKKKITRKRKLRVRKKKSKDTKANSRRSSKKPQADKIDSLAKRTRSGRIYGVQRAQLSGVK